MVRNFHVARSLIDNLLSDIKGYVNSGESLMRLAVKMQNFGIALEQMKLSSGFKTP